MNFHECNNYFQYDVLSIDCSERKKQTVDFIFINTRYYFYPFVDFSWIDREYGGSAGCCLDGNRGGGKEICGKKKRKFLKFVRHGDVILVSRIILARLS